ncbi:major facilitator superfamily transporter [Zopfia rhizophila CBS 207.26]|uniref:Major facilitator superfamily transporter n=1 Tax=Zopfia rhizophila CBS 207.26 TaxID=1314779 RepID=A0A6A6EE59_9PEZI|nr:major facilitator superfamily transporter [Zopfia rhizophila CBS 207.26]
MTNIHEKQEAIPDIESVPQSSDGQPSLHSGFNPEITENIVVHLTGWRLHLTTLCVLVSLLLINVEVTIVSTSLVAITNELHGFSKTSWIVTGYLVTYMGFMIFWSKLSDIIGRKSALISTMTIFTAFSGGCGGAKTLNQLIIGRTFQGIGGAGAYSLATLMTYEMVPKEKMPLYGTFNSATVALATLLGPLLGGAINDRTTWRWVFYLNLPLGAIVVALLFIALPAEFPYGTSSAPRKSAMEKLKNFKRIDITGGLFLLAGSLLLSTVLLDTSVRHGWASALTISLLVLGIVSWIAFFAWEWLVSRSKMKQEPMFPWHWMHNRPWIGMLISNFLAGMPFNVVVVFLPQRFQTVSGTSPLTAGIRLLPYTFGAAIGAALAMVASSKRRVAVVYILLVGATLQVIGITLLSTLPNTQEFPAKAYGFETIAGVGMGVSFGMLVLATGFVMQGPDLASAAGAIIQFRFLGGVIGLAIATNVMNEHLKSDLGHILPSAAVSSLLESVAFLDKLSPGMKAPVIKVFANAYNLQNKIMIAFAAAQFPAAAMIWNKKWSKIG